MLTMNERNFMQISTIKKSTHILTLLLVLPFHYNIDAGRSYIPEVIAGTAVAGVVTLLGILGWKAMTNEHLEHQQQLAFEHNEREKKVLDDVQAINPQVEFGSLLQIIAYKESIDTVAAYCIKHNMNIDNLSRSIASAKNYAHEAYARLQAHAESWRNNNEYENYYQRAMTLLEQKSAALVSIDRLHTYFEMHQDYLNLYQTYYIIDNHSYVFTKDPFGLIHAVEALDKDAKELKQALNQVTCKNIYDMQTSECLLMINKAAQKVSWLNHTRDTMLISKEYSEQLCHKLLAEQKEKELAIQRELLDAQKKQTQAMQDRVRLEEKNYQRRIDDLQRKILDLYGYLHTQQSIIASLETEIAALKRLHGRDVNNIADLVDRLHNLQNKIREFERQNPAAEASPAASW
jgi:hypothetical protein